MLPALIENPTEEVLIELPAMTPDFLDIGGGIGDDSFSEDLLIQQIPANTVQQHDELDAYRIRLLNPDSGLHRDSDMDDFMGFIAPE
jgi:hypothetical protein